MPALAMGLGWLGYTLGLWGYCLVRGYNVTLLELVDFRNVPTWASISASQIPPGQVLPSSGGLQQQASGQQAAATAGAALAQLAPLAKTKAKGKGKR